MTDYTDLIARLRVAYEVDTPLYITTEAADAIVALVAERDAAVAALLAAAQWQPIETAPKDGTRVLAFGPVGFWVAAYRLPTLGEPQNQTHYVKEWRDGGGRWATPTHWMPLPPPPSTP